MNRVDRDEGIDNNNNNNNSNNNNNNGNNNNFDGEGNLVKTYQKFTDIALPLDVRREVYMANKGWTMTQNKYVASGNGDLIEKENYKIKLENGNQKRTMKIDPRTSGGSSVASNE